MHLRNHFLISGIIGAAFLTFLSSCTRIELPTADIFQTGTASWYGKDFHGRTTSNQEIFNMYELTAAHPTLPFNTLVMVTNLNNGKSVIVRINDRGPFVKNRVIDLSYAAAKLLDMVDLGVAPVKLEVLNDTSFTKDTFFSVQVGSFLSKKNAQELKKHLEKKYQNVSISLFKTKNETYYRVRIIASSQENAEVIAHQLIKDGFSILIIDH